MEIIVAVGKSGPELKVFFGVVLLLLIGAGIYMFRNRRKFFGYTGDSSDSYASANLRMWMVILIWIHSVIITAIMIFEV
jgi:hypothetical protein